MQKIISLFKRDYKGTRLVYDKVVSGAEWVQAGEGRATRKYEGACCMVKECKLYKRYEVKKGKKAPADFIPVSDVDPETGKQQGWRPVGDGPEDKYFREAFDLFHGPRGGYCNGTYELLGPKVECNPEHTNGHILIRHGQDFIEDAPRTFTELREWFKDRDIEGIVWWHPDGRMAKIKAKDFGIKRVQPGASIDTAAN